MNRNARDAKLDEEIEALEAEYYNKFGKTNGGAVTSEDEEEPVAVVEPQELPAANAEEETWKKRYSDHRSYAQKQINDKETKIAELERKVLEAERNGQKLPQNKEDWLQWVKDFPDLARIISTGIEEHTDIVREDVRSVREELQEARTAAAEERAVQKLLVAHPDFFDFNTSDKFVAWVEEQPTKRGERFGQMLFDSLYNNRTDADSAIQTINLYKQDMKANKPDNRAAEKVGRSTSTTPATNGGRKQWLESDIDKLTAREFDKFSDEIEDARLEGRIIYDQSGAAR